MYYFQRVEERSKQARKALKNCELAQRQKKFGFKEAVISSRGECTGCRNPDDGTLDRKCKRCQYNEYYEVIMLFLAAAASAITARTIYTAKIKRQGKQRYFAMPASGADGMTEIRRIRINGNRNAMNISSRRNRQKETGKNSKL